MTTPARPKAYGSDAYLGTVERMEPDIAMVDRDGALASIAVSLKRIADSMESSQEALHELVKAVYHRPTIR